MIFVHGWCHRTQGQLTLINEAERNVEMLLILVWSFLHRFSSTFPEHCIVKGQTPSKWRIHSSRRFCGALKDLRSVAAHRLTTADYSEWRDTSLNFRKSDLSTRWNLTTGSHSNATGDIITQHEWQKVIKEIPLIRMNLLMSLWSYCSGYSLSLSGWRNVYRTPKFGITAIFSNYVYRATSPLQLTITFTRLEIKYEHVANCQRSH